MRPGTCMHALHYGNISTGRGFSPIVPFCGTGVLAARVWGLAVAARWSSETQGGARPRGSLPTVRWAPVPKHNAHRIFNTRTRPTFSRITFIQFQGVRFHLYTICMPGLIRLLSPLEKRRNIQLVRVCAWVNMSVCLRVLQCMCVHVNVRVNVQCVSGASVL